MMRLRSFNFMILPYDLNDPRKESAGAVLLCRHGMNRQADSLVIEPVPYRGY